MSIFTQEEAKIAVEQLVPGLYFIQDFTFNSDLSIRTWPYNYPTPPNKGKANKTGAICKAKF
jgi:hypothetical protein